MTEAEKHRKLQQLVLDYKKNPDSSRMKEIKEILFELVSGSRLFRDEDDKQETLLSIWHERKDGTSGFSRSLDSYDPDKTPQDFFWFFLKLCLLREKGFYKKRAELIKTLEGKEQIISTDPEIIETTAPSSNSTEIIYAILSEETRPLVLRALREITPDNYRDVLSFYLLFSQEIKQHEAADIFGMNENSIAKNLFRAKEKFAKNCERLIKEYEAADLETIHQALGLLRSQISLRFMDRLEPKLRRALERRFLEGVPRDIVCREFSITEEELIELERGATDDFLQSLSRLRRAALPEQPVSTEPFTVQDFLAYINGPLESSFTRAASQLSANEFYCLEIFKHVFPNKNQQAQIRIKQTLSCLDEAQLQDLCKSLETNTLDIVEAASRPDLHPELFEKLSRTLTGDI